MIENRRGVVEGLTVYSADGEKLGKVLQCEADSFVIEKGMFFPKDYIARYEDVERVDADNIHLGLTKDAFTAAGEMRRGGEYEEKPSLKERIHEKISGRETTRAGSIDVPIAEEELDITKRQREAGEVRVTKDVVTEHRQVDVPITKEQVHVERVPATERTAATPDAFQEKTVTMPVHEEEVEIRKRPVVKEEVRLRKEQHVEQRAAEADLRKEKVKIEGEGTRQLPPEPGSYRDPDLDK